MKKWRCTVCGYIHEGDTPPEECPVCGADASKFEEVSEQIDVQPAVESSGEQTAQPTAGHLVQETGSLFDKLTTLMLEKHVHPIAVHTPNGIVPAAVVFLVLAVAMNVVSLEQAAFYNMIFVLLAMPPVLFSGIVEWQKHYNGARTSVFLTKLACGVIVLTTVAIMVFWRLSNPEVAGADSPGRFLYILLSLVAMAAVGLAGHLGGKLVFGRKR